MADRLTILANSNVSRGKFAAAAVHAALNHYGIDHGAVIVLGAKGPQIEAECTDVVRDAGRTEVEPGTVTAGVKEHILADLRDVDRMDKSPIDALRECYDLWVSGAWPDSNAAPNLDEVMGYVGRLTAHTNEVPA